MGEKPNSATTNWAILFGQLGNTTYMNNVGSVIYLYTVVFTKYL